MILCEAPFHSIQGEGPNAGASAVFLRAAGCNLKCTFCDTLYSWGNESLAKKYTRDEILAFIEKANPETVVFTGGEPLLLSNMSRVNELLDVLSDKYHIEFETNGSLPFHLHSGIHRKVQLNISPKLSNSGNPRYDLRVFDNFNILKLRENFNYCVKFVYDKESENEILQLLNVPLSTGYIERNKVYIMPKGKTVEEMNSNALNAIEFCKKYQFRYCHRVHVAVWGDKQGV